MGNRMTLKQSTTATRLSIVARLTAVWQRGCEPAEIAVATRRAEVTALRDLHVAETCTKDSRVVERRASIASSSRCFRDRLSVQEAFDDFVRGAESVLSPERRAARDRIQLAHALSRADNVRHLIAARLDDLHLLLFNGALGKNVPVVWKAMPPEHWGTTCGRREFGSSGKLTVYLAENLQHLADHDRDFVWGTLVHELLHAYALVMSPDHEMCLCGNWVHHGPGFRAAAVAAVELLDIETIGLDSVVDWDTGCCHADADEQALRAREEQDGECALGFFCYRRGFVSTGRRDY